MRRAPSEQPQYDAPRRGTRPEAPSRDRRATRRIPTLFTASGVEGVQLADLSYAGACLERSGGRPLEVGRSVRLALSHPLLPGPPLELSGRVVWSGGERAGLRFDPLGDGERRRLRCVLAAELGSLVLDWDGALLGYVVPIRTGLWKVYDPAADEVGVVAGLARFRVRHRGVDCPGTTSFSLAVALSLALEVNPTLVPEIQPTPWSIRRTPPPAARPSGRVESSGLVRARPRRPTPARDSTADASRFGASARDSACTSGWNASWRRSRAGSSPARPRPSGVGSV